MKPKISIVIPTHSTEYNQQVFLRDIIAAIIHSYGFDESVETIIVENPTKTETVANIIKDICHNRKYNFIHIESKLGANKARNVGIQAAKSDLIGLLDDDCMIGREWINTMISAHQIYPHVGVIGGAMKLMFKCAKPRWVEGYFNSMLAEVDHGEQVINCDGGNFGIVSGNLSFKRAIYNLTDGFDESLGYVGSNCMAQDEISFIENCAKNGKPGILYAGYAIVYHQIGESRLNIEYFIKKSYGDGFNLGRLLHNNKSNKDLSIEDFITIHALPLWSNFIDCGAISEIRNRISHEESMRLYIRNLIKCKVAFFQGFEDYMQKSGIYSYVDSLSNPIFISSVSTKR